MSYRRCCCPVPCTTCYGNCPSGSVCQPYGFSSYRCAATSTHRCVKSYSFTISGTIKPANCCDPSANPNCSGTKANAGCFGYHQGTGNWRRLDTMPSFNFSASYTFDTEPIAGSKYDIGSVYNLSPSGDVYVTGTSGNYDISVRLYSVTAGCNSMGVYVSWTYTRKLCYVSGTPTCADYAAYGGSLQLNYTKVSGSASCPLAGTFNLSSWSGDPKTENLPARDPNDVASLCGACDANYYPHTFPVNTSCNTDVFNDHTFGAIVVS